MGEDQQDQIVIESQSISAGDPEQQWLKSLADELRRKESYGSLSSASVGHSIFKVPRQLREVNPFAYDPLVVAIGPYKKSRKLQPSVTESFMRISAAKILMPLQNLGPDDFQEFVRHIVGDHYSIEKLVMQYERMPTYKEDAIKALFALDSSFIACFLVWLGYGDVRPPASTPSTWSTWTSELATGIQRDLKIPERLITSILRDLFLFENQIPLSLIKGVLSSITTAAKGSISEREKGEEEDELLVMCIERVISCVNPFQVENMSVILGRGHIMEGERPTPNCIIHEHRHLLDCLYTAVAMDGGDDQIEIGDDQIARSRVQSTVGICGLALRGRGFNMQRGVHTREVEERMGLSSAVESAIHLRRAGICFKPSDNGPLCSTVLSIRFDKASATLYLPRVNINQDSEAVLRNLAAYEMVALQGAAVGSYLTLMDDLIDTAADVEVLRLNGILTHTLRNDEEVAEMWNNICKNLQVLYETEMLAKVYQAMKDHLHRRMRYKMWWELYAEFRTRYFSTPWLTTSILAATLLLLLTITQTVYSVALYYKS